MNTHCRSRATKSHYCFWWPVTVDRQICRYWLSQTALTLKTCSSEKPCTGFSFFVFNDVSRLSCCPLTSCKTTNLAPPWLTLQQKTQRSDETVNVPSEKSNPLCISMTRFNWLIEHMYFTAILLNSRRKVQALLLWSAHLANCGKKEHSRDVPKIVNPSKNYESRVVSETWYGTCRVATSDALYLILWHLGFFCL